LLPSGGQATFDNRVGWARTYMKKAGLLESPRRSYFKITDRGLQALKTNPESINNRFLQQYP
jgi:restriction system protein